MVAGRFRFAVRIEDTFVPLLRARQFLVGDLLAGTVDDTHPLAGWLDRHGFGDDDLAWCADNPAPPDVVGSTTTRT